MEQQDRELFEKLAKEVEKRQMTAPFIFYLEMHRPLAFVFSSFLLALKPLMQMFSELPDYQRIVELLEEPEAVEELIQILEKVAKESSNSESRVCAKEGCEI